MQQGSLSQVNKWTIPVVEQTMKEHRPLPHNPYSLTQRSSKTIEIESNFSKQKLALVQISIDRGARFLYSMLLLIGSSILCFLLVKGTANCAANSKSELNRYRDARNKYLVDSINERFNYIRRAE